MENPQCWTEAEHIVQRVLDRRAARDADPEMQFWCGWSLPMEICSELRAAGLLAPLKIGDTKDLTASPEPAKFVPEVENGTRVDKQETLC